LGAPDQGADPRAQLAVGWRSSNTKLLASSRTRKFNHEDIYECVLVLEKRGCRTFQHIWLLPVGLARFG